MAITFSSAFLNTYVAPRITEVGNPSPPDLHMLRTPLVHSFALITALGVRNPKEPVRATLVHLFRRTEGAIGAYEDARASLADFTAQPVTDGNVSPYFRALRHFETSVSYAYQAIVIIRKLMKVDRFFEPGDGSQVERLWQLYNIVRHAETKIENGELPEDGSLPIWITTEGLTSTTATLTYAELADMLRDLHDSSMNLINAIGGGKAQPQDGSTPAGDS
jgi:hypothetical protein